MIKSPVDRFEPLTPVESTGMPRAYRISPNSVLLFDPKLGRVNTKAYLNEETERLKLDAYAQKQLQYSDYNVPISFGVAHFKLPMSTWFARRGDVVAAHLMSYVEGVSAAKLPDNSAQKDLALEKYAKLLDRIGNDHSLDVTPVNTGLRRVIFTTTGDICLYDFSGWKQGRN